MAINYSPFNRQSSNKEDKVYANSRKQKQEMDEA